MICLRFAFHIHTDDFIDTRTFFKLNLLQDLHRKISNLLLLLLDFFSTLFKRHTSDSRVRAEGKLSKDLKIISRNARTMPRN